MLLLRRNGGHFGSLSWLDISIISRFLGALAETHFLLEGIEGFRLLGVHSNEGYSLAVNF